MDNFDLKKYLVENKVTRGSKLLNEEDSMGRIGKSYPSPKDYTPKGKVAIFAEDIVKNLDDGTIKDIKKAIKKEGLEGSALVDWIIEEMEIIEQEFGEGTLISWNNEKNKRLKAERNVSFEEVVFHIEQEQLLDIVQHPNQEKYPGQRVFIININNYAYLVPFIESKRKVFLKTIIPSRKATRRYLRKEERWKKEF